MPNTICYITGFIKDSGGKVLSGKLRITLDANLRDTSTNPDSLLTRAPAEYIITNGIVDDPSVATPVGIGLLESESQQVTYFFEFFRLISVGVYETKAFIDFHEIVPDVATAEFEQLARETGVTTTNLSTGALKVSREILVNPVLAPLIFYSAQLFRSETKPITTVVGTINDGAIWFQPSKGITWRYDAARAKWKSNPFTVQVGLRNQSVNNSSQYRQVQWREFPQIVLERVELRYYILAAPNDGTNNWFIYMNRQTINSDTGLSLVSAVDTSGMAINTIHKVTYSPNGTLNPSDLDTVGIVLTKNANPGNITVSCSFIFSYLDS